MADPKYQVGQELWSSHWAFPVSSRIKEIVPESLDGEIMYIVEDLEVYPQDLEEVPESELFTDHKAAIAQCIHDTKERIQDFEDDIEDSQRRLSVERTGLDMLMKELQEVIDKEKRTCT
jgi:hypothetical protein